MQITIKYFIFISVLTCGAISCVKPNLREIQGNANLQLFKTTDFEIISAKTNLPLAVKEVLPLIYGENGIADPDSKLRSSPRVRESNRFIPMTRMLFAGVKGNLVFILSESTRLEYSIRLDILKILSNNSVTRLEAWKIFDNSVIPGEKPPKHVLRHVEYTSAESEMEKALRNMVNAQNNDDHFGYPALNKPRPTDSDELSKCYLKLKHISDKKITRIVYKTL